MAVYLGNELVLANGVGGTSLANGHASTHAKGGSDELAPADIGAAEEVHTHTEYALKPVSMVVELPLDGWVVGTYSCTQAHKRGRNEKRQVRHSRPRTKGLGRIRGG